MDRRSWTVLVALSAVWGSSFMLTALAIEDLSGAVVSFLRTGVGALVLLPVALARGAFRGARSHLGAILVVGVVQLAGPFMLIAYGQLEVPSGLAGILVASTPLWTALLAVWLDQDERSRGWGLAGIGVGIAGVALLLGVQIGGSLGTLVGAVALLLAGFGYAAGGFLAKHQLGGMEPLGAVSAAMIAGSVVLAPFAALALPTAAPSARAMGAALVLGAASGGLGWLMYYTLLARAGAAKAAISMYLMPAFAVGYGVVLLGEPMTVGTVVGLVLVVGGSWLAASGGSRTPAVTAAPAPAGVPEVDLPQPRRR